MHLLFWKWCMICKIQYQSVQFKVFLPAFVPMEPLPKFRTFLFHQQIPLSYQFQLTLLLFHTEGNQSCLDFCWRETHANDSFKFSPSPLLFGHKRRTCQFFFFFYFQILGWLNWFCFQVFETRDLKWHCKIFFFLTGKILLN